MNGTQGEFFRALLSNGSTTNAIGDYSTTAETFFYEVPAGRKLVLTRFSAWVVFTGKTDVLYYGPVTTELTNGIVIRAVSPSGDPRILTPVSPIKSNWDLGVFGTDGGALQVDPDTNKNDQGFVGITLEPRKVMGLPAGGLEMASGSKIEAVLNDDFATPTILRHEFEIAGRLLYG